MKVLFVHNFYQQRGGEDGVVEAEIELLRKAGHEVLQYFRHNDDINSMGKAAVAYDTLWSRRTVSDMTTLLVQQQPDVIHVHNTFPLISPSLYWAAARACIPVVQTLHNFRFLCPQAMFLRDGRVCEDCIGKVVPWRSVVHKCYRDSAAQSAVLASMITLHLGLGTYRNKVTRYIALNEFCRSKFIEGGLPPDRILVKPNFIESPEVPTWRDRQGGLFVGRLSQEKGLVVLATAVKLLQNNTLKVIGGGDMDAFAQSTFGSAYLGFQSLESILDAMRRASYLVLPSIWYENFPRTIVEAFACGLPVIASRIGALAEIVDAGRTGLLFEPGNAADLAEKIAWAEAHTEEMVSMGKAARAEYEFRYTAEHNYVMLMDIYYAAIAAKQAEV